MISVNFHPNPPVLTIGKVTQRFIMVGVVLLCAALFYLQQMVASWAAIEERRLSQLKSLSERLNVYWLSTDQKTKMAHAYHGRFSRYLQAQKNQLHIINSVAKPLSLLPHAARWQSIDVSAQQVTITGVTDQLEDFKSLFAQRDNSSAVTYDYFEVAPAADGGTEFFIKMLLGLQAVRTAL